MQCKRSISISSLLFLLLAFTACERGVAHLEEDCQLTEDAAFSLMSCDPATGMDFRNDLHYTDQLNPYTYRNFYNGGGVGIADFNGDGLPDIFLSGNLVDNKLYLNRGDWHFEDVTAAAGVACPDSWSTGVAIVDIDADGDQDIYVCKAGPPAGEKIAGMTGVRHNELFLNNGDATFREASAEYGLDIVGLSIHAAFFDYDQDGDLDAYLLNNSTRSTTGYDLKKGLRETADPEGGNKLLKNLASENGKGFSDVTQQANIYSSAIGFGLGVTVGDVNEDGLPDLFVSNDFFERDYLYFNNGDGTFREDLPAYLPEISQGSMGADFADLDNDGLPELFVTEMLPRQEYRRKTTAAFNGWNRYQLFRDQGYHQQFSRNVLQHNRGDGRFSELSRMAGVAATDWSWGALLFDMDNDGLRDIFVANGNGKDLLDQDYINFNANPEAIRKAIFEEGKSITDVIDKIPAQPLVNGVFRADGELAFTEVAAAWGLDQETFSNGAAYGDLDNDGDLDLVVNNIDGRVGVYRNNTLLPGRTLHLRPRPSPNTDAIGAKVYAYVGQRVTYTELQPMRGFQSTVDKRIHVAGEPDSILVRWPEGAWETFRELPGTPVLQLAQGKGLARTQDAVKVDKSRVGDLPNIRVLQKEMPGSRHVEDRATEFDRDPLLLLGLNNEGPALAYGAAFSDCKSCYGYLGGAAGQSGQMIIAGKASLKAADLFAEDAAGENVDAVWFDVNGDNMDDLYVVNGSHQFANGSTALIDKLYITRSNGTLKRSSQILPVSNKFVSGSCARPYDVDGDGDLDLFVGARLRPGTYGVPADSYLLLNDGKGNFSDAKLPGLQKLGMVTDAAWAEMDLDKEPELVVSLDCGPIVILHFSDGRIEEKEVIPNSGGIWHTLSLGDMNGDGSTDIVAGNHGLNTSFRASETAPLELHVNDFDRNGRADQLLVMYDETGKRYPLTLRDDLVKTMPALRKGLPTYADYASKRFDELFPAALRDKSVVSQIHELASVVFLNGGKDGYEKQPLPREAQLAPVYAIATSDLDGDGDLDLIIGGNQTVAKPEIGINAASFGSILLNDGKGAFIALGPKETGMVLEGDIRQIKSTGNRSFTVARSNGTLIQLQIER
ncbi:Repeat domain-containing protein [Neolewinella agarilytica]|uniref:Repeat domain-containing protein n=1 Tax=Neolewinella agarilytica TaxID=478744 RepID=A0A1H9EH09_9BACT|nr:Repeat domain-containing protein [Neolewinella agarilytica]